jgi:hypothetical protein
MLYKELALQLGVRTNDLRVALVKAGFEAEVAGRKVEGAAKFPVREVPEALAAALLAEQDKLARRKSTRKVAKQVAALDLSAAVAALRPAPEEAAPAEEAAEG